MFSGRKKVITCFNILRQFPKFSEIVGLSKIDSRCASILQGIGYLTLRIGSDFEPNELELPNPNAEQNFESGRMDMNPGLELFEESPETFESTAASFESRESADDGVRS